MRPSTPFSPLSRLAQMVLLAVLCAAQEGDADGSPGYDALTTRTRRRVARGAVYMTLDRLEKKGLLSSSLTAPTPERGGRAKRCYRVTKPALAALRASQQALANLWAGVGVDLKAGR